MASAAVTLRRANSCVEFELLGAGLAAKAAALGISSSPTGSLPPELCLNPEPPQMNLGTSASVPVTRQEAAKQADIIANFVQAQFAAGKLTGPDSNSKTPVPLSTILATLSRSSGSASKPPIGVSTSSFSRLRPLYPPEFLLAKPIIRLSETIQDDPSLVDRSRGERIDLEPPADDADIRRIIEKFNVLQSGNGIGNLDGEVDPNWVRV